MTYIAPHYAQLSPCLAVRNGADAVEFYEKAFGFTPIDLVKDDKGEVRHAALKMEGCTIMLFPEESMHSDTSFWKDGQTPKTSGTPPAVSLYIYVSDADAIYAKAIAAGAKSLLAPQDAFWGDRFCKVEDPDGHQWGFGTHRG